MDGKGISRHRRGFTLTELLVVVSVLTIVMAMLLPMVYKGRSVARNVICQSNLKNLAYASLMYAQSHDGHFMPLATWGGRETRTYWWGTYERPIDHTKGFLYPFLKTDLGDGSVFECPEQPPGTYQAQGPARRGGNPPTSTYGYNGYYLCPPATIGHDREIGFRPWVQDMAIPNPSQVIMFADTLIEMYGTVKNCCLLDPPFLFQNGEWVKNDTPTTCFRHSGRANAVFVDSHVESLEPQGGNMTNEKLGIGSYGPDNSYYVPDWSKWQSPR